MLFNKKLPGSLAGSKSSFTLTADADKGKIMQTAIGQGDTLVSPLHMVFCGRSHRQSGCCHGTVCGGSCGKMTVVYMVKN